jgi:hypothetical protein
MQVIQGVFEGGCTLEAFLANRELELAVRNAVFERVNTLKEFFGGANERRAVASKSAIEEVARIRQSLPE